MSLLADLLSKIKQPQPKREVPPNLKSIVQSSASRSAARRKIFIISGIAFLFVLAGIIVVYFVNTLSDTSDIGMTRPQLIAKSEATPDKKESSVKAVKRSNAEQNGQTKKTLSARPEKVKKKKILAKKQKAIISASSDVVASNLKDNEDVPALANEETKEIDIAARDALLYKAREFEMKQEYSSALGTYKEVLEIDSDNVMVLNSIAYIYLKLGLVQESIQYALMAEERDVDYTPALINLGIAYAKSGNVTAAEYYLDRAYKSEPDNKNAIFNLALLNERKQNYSGAAEYYTKLTRLGDTEGTLGLARVYVGLARVYEKQDRNAEALKLYKKVSLLESLDQQKRVQIRQRIMILQSEDRKE